MESSDVIIIGGGLSGLLTGHLLFQKGYSVVVCEAQEKLGGRCRIDTAHGVLVDYGIHFNILTPELMNPLGINLEWVHVFSPPLMFQKIHWIPVDMHLLTPEQKFFFRSEFVLPKGGMGKVLETLSQKIKIEFSQPIQQCLIEDLHIKKVIGNRKEWEAKGIVIATPWNSLISLIGQDKIHPQFLRKLKRQETVSALKLDIVLKSKIFNGENILFFPECNGVGFSASNVDATLSDGDYQLFQWVFFLDKENFFNNEAITKKLKAGKRLIAKAFPDFFDKVIWERVTLIESLFPKERENEPFKKEWTTLKNLFWVGDFQGGPSPRGNTLVGRALEEVQRVENFLLSG